MHLHQDRADQKTFYVSWIRSPGNYGQRVFQAPTIQMAIDEMPVIAGYAPARKTRLLLLSEAFNLTLRQARRGEKSAFDWRDAVVHFINWLDDNHCTVLHWNQLSRSLLTEYLDSIQKNGRPLSDSMRRARLQPIIQTDGFVSREFGFPRIAEALHIGTSMVHETPAVYLADVLSLLDHLRTHAPALEPLAALQGLAGIRLQEAYRLTWDKIDLVRGLIEISGQTKNEFSQRIIPICSRAAQSLHTANIIPIGSAPLTDHPTWQKYSIALAAEIHAWNPKITWTPKDLRKALPNFFASEGLANDLTEQYIGHAPKTVTARHYVARLGSISKGEQTALEKEMALFRRVIIVPLDTALASAQAPVEVPPISTQAQEVN